VTKDEFFEAVEASHISQRAFSLSGDGSECYVLKRQSAWFEVFYAERGLETDLHYFSDEAGALDHLLRMLRNDPTTVSLNARR